MDSLRIQIGKGMTVAAALGLLMAPASRASQKDTRERLALSATVLDEVLKAPDNGIPDDMLKQAHCAVVVPGLKKGAFIVSGQYGKGFMTCRKGTGWSAPA